MQRADIEDVYQLSPLQQGMLFHSLHRSQDDVYVVQFCLSLAGPLSLRALEQAWERVVAHHPVLRTSFHWEKLQAPSQVVHRRVELPIEPHDWRGSPADLRRFLAEDRTRGFDLTRAPLLRLSVLRTGPEEHLLVWTHHHLLLDGWSVALVVGQVLTLYEALARGDGERRELERSRPFRDYIAWLRRQDLGEAERFWRRELAGFAAPTSLGSREPLPGRSGFGDRTLRLAAADTAALHALAREHQLTVNTLVQGAWALLLARYSGERDVLFGVTVSGRPASLPGVESMVGLFINTLPLRVGIEPDAPPLAWLRSLQERQAAIRQHEHSPLFEVQGWSDAPRGAPLFHSLFVFENFPTAAERRAGPTSVEIREIRLVETSNYPLTLAVTPGAELALRAIYDRARFDEAEIVRLQEHLRTLLQGLAAGRGQGRLGDLEVLGEAERHQALVEWNDTDVELPNVDGLHRLVEEWAGRAPDAPALTSGDGGVLARPRVEAGSAAGARTQERAAANPGHSPGDWTLSYGELNRRADLLARRLGERGVGAGSVVGLPAARSPELVVAMLAVLKAGGAYLPLDPGSPPERQAYMVEDSGASHGGSADSGAGNPPAGKEPSTQGSARGLGLGPDSLAYVLYTSGSTGRPKGVEVPHGGILRLVRPGPAGPLEMGTDQVWLQAAPAAFDASTLEIWSALANGGHLVLLPGGTPSLDEIAGAVQSHAVTSLWLTAGLFHQMVERGLGDLPSLRQLATGGDVVSAPHAEEALRQLPGIRLVDCYGPTENTVYASCHRLASPVGPAVPIGRPVPGTRVHLLDAELRPVPVGAAGRLFNGGRGLARGYLRRPDLTAERFLPDPFAALWGVPGARLYDTGDLARRRPDGVLEFLGRTDAQVKIRGHRVEPGEVEAVLCEHPEIAGTVVLARPDAAGSRRLVAWVVPHPGSAAGDPGSAPGPGLPAPPASGSGHPGRGLAEPGLSGPGISGPALRAWLAERLPEPLVPSAFVVLEALPLTASGKVDRRALPDPGERRREGAAPALGPRTPAEEVLAEIWGEVLGLERIGVDESFFDHGGHSLAAIQVVSRVRRTFDVELPLAALFEEPTVAALARRIEALRREREAVPDPPLVALPRDGGDPPLSFAQQRLWFLDRLEPGRPTYNIPIALRLQGDLGPGALESALAGLAARHETLRTTFPDGGGEPAQRIAPRTADVVAARLPRIDLQGLPQPRREAELRRLAAEEALASFDLAAGPLLRARLVRLAARDHLLLLTIHHIVSDGWSMSVLVRDLVELYGRERPALPALPVQYADYSVWQRQQLQGEALAARLAWWRERLAGAPALLELPLDRPRPPVRSARGASVPLALPADLAARIRALGRRHGATPHMTWLAGLAALLERYGCGADLPVGTTVANRDRRELEGLIGFFVNTLVLRVDAAADPAVSELLKRARETALAAYAHQDVPFEKLVADLQPGRDLSHTPLFQVLLGVNAPEPPVELPGLVVSPVRQPARTARFDLSLTVLEGLPGLPGDQDGPGEPGLCGNLTYAIDLFDAATAHRLVQHLAVLLAAMAESPASRLCELPLATEAELAQVLDEWSATAATAATADSAPGGPTVHEMFARQAAHTPGAPAVRYRDETLTFRELAARSLLLARHLRGRGVGPDVPVALLLERSTDLLAAVLGILAAGGAFVPIDPATPSRRLELMLEDCGAPLVVTQEGLLSRLPAPWRGGRAFCLDRVGDALAILGEGPPLPRVLPENLCYVIYTSGSTGGPKGVQVQHASVVNLAFALSRTVYTGLPPGLRVAVNAPLSFDGSIKQVIQVLSGHCVDFLPEELRLDPGALPPYLGAHAVDVLDCTPSQLRLFLGEEGELGAGGPRAVLVGGEVLDEPTWTVLASSSRSAFWNVYGPTECTVDTTVGRIEAGPVATGRPVPGAFIYVLDSDLRPVPAGVAGQLHVAGAGLARGYLGRPDLTAERFLPDPFAGRRGEPGARLYATGDLARWLPDGRIEVRGRIDRQVKVRGVRVEPGEIEAVLAQAPRVRDAAVVAVGRPEPHLVAWLVTAGDVGTDDLRSWLRNRLPAAMIPSDLVLTSDPLPRTPSGKLDRRALAERTPLRRAGREYVPPGDPFAERLAGLWSDLLGVERVGLHDNFFALGGHSLLVTRLAVRIRRQLGIEIPLRTLFEAADLGEMANAILRELLDDAGADSQGLLAELDGLSEEEVQELLQEEETVAASPLAPKRSSGRSSGRLSEKELP